MVENRIFDQAPSVQILIWVYFRGLQSVAVNLRYSDLESIGYFEVKSADEAEPDFYEIGRQPNFEGIFNEKFKKIAYHKKILRGRSASWASRLIMTRRAGYLIRLGSKKNTEWEMYASETVATN